jgi:hypothetical protein
MDVYDAGVYVYRFEAQVPAEMRTPLWGPLHAKELGLPGWEAQDGGETGFIYHKKTNTRKVGTMLVTMIVSNRAHRATLTVTLAGYPTHVPVEQRQLEALTVVTEAEVFLTRLAGRTVAFTRTASITLVDQNHPHEEILDRRDVAALPAASGTPGTAPRRMGRLRGGEREGEASGLWDVF